MSNKEFIQVSVFGFIMVALMATLLILAPQSALFLLILLMGCGFVLWVIAGLIRYYDSRP